MKKILALICCLAVVLSFTSCKIRYITKNGLENFNHGDSPIELTYMVPGKYIESFPYLNGDYWYHQKCEDLALFCEKFILYLQYDAETYDLAKSAALNHNKIKLDQQEPELTIGMYDFYLSGLESRFESQYTNRTIYMYLAFNEVEKTVCFLCLHSSNNTNKEETKAIDNLYATEGLKGIIDEYFIEWYDFYATNNA